MKSEDSSDTSKSAVGRAEQKRRPQKARVVVSVREISCTLCAQAIEKQVGRMNGIEDVRTAIMLNKVFIDYDPKMFDSTAIRKAIDKTGFKSYMTVEDNH